MKTASSASSDETQDIPSEEVVARSLLYSVFFDNEMLAESLIFPWGKSAPDGAYHASLAWRRFAPEDEDLHAYGCRLAANQNVRLGEPARGEDRRRYYCGFKQATAGALTIENDFFRTELRHLPEGGEAAHVDLSLTLKMDGKAARANARSEAGLELVGALSPTAPHVCECDLADEFHPISRWGHQCLGTCA